MCNLRQLVSLLFITSAVSGASLRIIGGTEAAPGEFPFLVSVQLKGRLGTENQHNCGGTIINMTRVVTAAHCVTLGGGIYHPSEIAVVAGSHYLPDALRGIQQARDVAHIAVHHDYDPVLSRHDIAVLELSAPFGQDFTVGPANIPWRSQHTTGQCWIAGWGPTTSSSNGMSDALMKGRITVNSKQDCVNAYGNDYDGNTQICAGNMNGETVDTCFGDTGGPLMCYNTDGVMYFAGVSSWGHGCGAPNMPGVYMEIAKYRNWLDSVVMGDSETPPPEGTTPGRPSDEQSDVGGTTKTPVPALPEDSENSMTDPPLSSSVESEVDQDQDNVVVSLCA